MKNIREYIKRCCIILVYLSIFISCSKRDESNYNLYFDYRNSIVINKDFPFKNLMIHNYVDSIVLLKKYDESFILKYKYMLLNDGYFEIRKKGWEDDNSLGYDSILTLTKSDTTFVHYASYLQPGPIIFFSFCNSKYKIMKIDKKKFISIKQSLIDTTYFEKIYYDDKYHIYKFEYSYQKNMVIYK